MTLEDVDTFYQSIYRPEDAILMFSGDITPEQSKARAMRLLDQWKPAGSLSGVDYSLPAKNRQIENYARR